MKITNLFLLHMTNSEKFIKNINIPSCRNCVYFKPNSFSDFTYNGKCEKFGTKDLVTDKISYSYADSNRHDENICGKNGKYFEEENNINLKILKHQILNNWLYMVPTLILIIINFFIYLQH